MFCRSVVFLAFLGLSAAFVVAPSSEEGLRVRRSAHYNGPLAALNKDGTVALTPEVQHARAAHEAAIAAEFMRLEEAKRLAASHPDLTSPPDQGWHDHHEYDSQGKGHHPGGFSSSSNSIHNTKVPSYDKGQYSHGYSTSQNAKTYMPAPLNKDGTVALTPEVQQAKAAHDAAFDAALKRLMEAHRLAMAHPDLTSSQEYAKGHYNQEPHSDQRYSPVHSKNPEAQMPAPLNPDGTVAQTAAYKAIASSLNAEYMKALQNIKHQAVDPHFQHRAAQGYSY